MRLAAVLAFVFAGCGGSSQEAASNRDDEAADSATVADQGSTLLDSTADSLAADALAVATDGTTPDAFSPTESGLVTDTAVDSDPSHDDGDVGTDAGAVADTGPTPDAVAETGPTTVTMPFIVLAGSGAPDIGDYSDGGWDGLNARMAPSTAHPLQTVSGGRKLPGAGKWGTWSATINLDLTHMTCKGVKVQTAVAWTSSDGVNHGTRADIDLPDPATTPSPTITVGGTFPAPLPEPDPGYSYSLVMLSLTRSNDGCGTLYAKPSSFTFTQL